MANATYDVYGAELLGHPASPVSGRVEGQKASGLQNSHGTRVVEQSVKAHVQAFTAFKESRPPKTLEGGPPRRAGALRL
jgi:hypothetical protein